MPAWRGPGLWKLLAQVGGLAVGAILRCAWVPQFFQVPYTALTMLLTPSPRERDSATAYRECRWAWGGVPLPPAPQAWSLCSVLCPGMTMEMAGTLMGAAVHGLIVSGAHGSHRCDEATLPGQVAVFPNAVSAQAAQTHWDPHFRVTSSFQGHLSLRALRGPLGAQLCTARPLIPSLLL